MKQFHPLCFNALDFNGIIIMQRMYGLNSKNI